MATHSTHPTDLGTNRTGVQTSPLQTKEMLDNTSATAAVVDPLVLAAARAELSSSAPPIGTMPVPGNLKGVAKTAMQALKGEKATVFIDKLGERLAFERTGVRLYEAVLAKVPAASNDKGTLTAAELRRHHDEELQHFLLVKDAIETLGGDPTAQTPCADLVAVQGMGLVQAVTDPRTTLTQCLDTILAAELIDNDGWAMLISMARAMGQNELVQRFREAVAAEARHLTQVRKWLAERLGIELGAQLPPPALEHPAHV